LQTSAFLPLSHGRLWNGRKFWWEYVRVAAIRLTDQEESTSDCREHVHDRRRESSSIFTVFVKVIDAAKWQSAFKVWSDIHPMIRLTSWAEADACLSSAVRAVILFFFHVK
jgi:hypothetical protein